MFKKMFGCSSESSKENRWNSFVLYSDIMLNMSCIHIFQRENIFCLFCMNSFLTFGLEILHPSELYSYISYMNIYSGLKVT